jgi:cytoskeletal protein RodZ
MHRVSAFIIGVVVCLWVLSPAFAQKDPKPYDDSKRKKSSAKSDTTKTESAKSDTTKTESDESKSDKSKTDKSKTKKSETDKSKTDKSEAKKSETDKSKTDKSKAKKSETDKSKTKEPEMKSVGAQKPEATKPAAAKADASGHIARATFTSAIVEREPADTLESLTTAFDRVYFFTEIVDMQGKQITHQWIYEDKVVAEVPFQVGGPRWRVYSSKRLAPGWVGRWTVVVVDETGRKLREDSFAYVGSAQ